MTWRMWAVEMMPIALGSSLAVAKIVIIVQTIRARTHPVTAALSGRSPHGRIACFGRKVGPRDAA